LWQDNVHDVLSFPPWSGLLSFYSFMFLAFSLEYNRCLKWRKFGLFCWLVNHAAFAYAMYSVSFLWLLCTVYAVLCAVWMYALLKLSKFQMSVDDEGRWSQMTDEEKRLRGKMSKLVSLAGRYISFTDFVPYNVEVGMTDPDRRDTRVQLIPNLCSYTRREILMADSRLVDRSSRLVISSSLLYSLAAERGGLLRGKTYEEGRRILQNYADTQNHTQIELVANLVGLSSTSLAENTVELFSSMRMADAFSPAPLNLPETRYYQ